MDTHRKKKQKKREKKEKRLKIAQSLKDLHSKGGEIKERRKEITSDLSLRMNLGTKEEENQLE